MKKEYGRLEKKKKDIFDDVLKSREVGQN